MFHFTNKDGYDAIRSQQAWTFLATSPPGPHPSGAYFTTLPPGTPKLATRLRIPRSKTDFVFAMEPDSQLLPIDGGRGAFILYSPHDYVVMPPRQRYHGPSEEYRA